MNGRNRHKELEVLDGCKPCNVLSAIGGRLYCHTVAFVACIEIVHVLEKLNY